MLLVLDKVGSVVQASVTLEGFPEPSWKYTQVGNKSCVENLGMEESDSAKILTKLIKVLSGLTGEGTHYTGSWAPRAWDKSSIKNIIKVTKETATEVDPVGLQCAKDKLLDKGV